MKKLGPVAIIGAGLSGLSCAQALQTAGVSTHVYESSKNIGGRCATQLWQGHLVDVGVQFFTAQSAEFKKELLTRLRQFRPIVSPLLNQDQQVIPNDLGPRFYVLQGNNYFAHILSQGINVRLSTPVENLTFKSTGVLCAGESYRAVVSSLPAPLTAKLFGLAQAAADYEPCLVGLLEYAGNDLGRARECYGRLHPKDEVVQASFCENNKVGRIVGNKTVFVVEASPIFSRAFTDAPSETYLPELARRHEEIWNIPRGQMTAAYGHAWKLARPIPATKRRVTPPAGAFICGDSRADANVESVWLDGVKTAADVISYLAKHPA